MNIIRSDAFLLMSAANFRFPVDLQSPVMVKFFSLVSVLHLEGNVTPPAILSVKKKKLSVKWGEMEIFPSAPLV